MLQFWGSFILTLNFYVKHMFNVLRQIPELEANVCKQLSFQHSSDSDLI